MLIYIETAIDARCPQLRLKSRLESTNEQTERNLKQHYSLYCCFLKTLFHLKALPDQF